MEHERRCTGMNHHHQVTLRFFLDDTAPSEIYTLSLHDALPISRHPCDVGDRNLLGHTASHSPSFERSEEHTSELQSRQYLVCRLLLEKKKTARGLTSSHQRSTFSRRVGSGIFQRVL